MSQKQSHDDVEGEAIETSETIEEADSIGLEVVAKVLIRRNFLLAALELYQELSEHGIQSPVLRDFFADFHESHSAEDDFSRFSQQVFRGSRHKKSTATSSSSASDLYASGLGGPHATGRGADELLSAKDDNISILEYELRLVKEDLARMTERYENLRKSTSGSSSLSTAIDNAGNATSRMGMAPSAGDGEMNLKLKMTEEKEMTDLERRTLLYAIQTFLVNSGLKLTAITLSDEVTDQNLTDWRDIGASIHDESAIPSMPSMLRAGQRYVQSNDDDEIEKEKEKKEELEREIAELKKQLDAAKTQSAKLEGEKVQMMQDNQRLKHYSGNTQAMKTLVEEQRGEIAHLQILVNQSISATVPGERVAVTTPTPTVAATEVKVEVDDAQPPTPAPAPVPYVPSESDNDIVSIVSQQLPSIVPNVLLNKREELIPVILAVIPAHPDVETRDKLTHMLFNLIKAPDENQRKLIINGCVALAQKIGYERTEEELLPQCWEQITHSRHERRILVADSCGMLSQYVRPEMRHSLIYSILSQLLDDNVDAVRSAVASNLATLIESFAEGNGIEKYSQIESSVFRLIDDSADAVAMTARDKLIPVVAQWTAAHGMLCSKLLESILCRIETGFADIELEEQKRESEIEGGGDGEDQTQTQENAGAGTGEMSDEVEEDDAATTKPIRGTLGALSLFEDLVPRLRAAVLMESTAVKEKRSDADVKIEIDGDGEDEEDECDQDMKIMMNDEATACRIVGSKDELKTLQHNVDFLLSAPLSADSTQWPSMDFVACEAIPRLAACAASLDDHLYPSLSFALTHAVWRVCSAMGRTFVRMVARPLFEQDLGSDSRGRVLTVFCGGILPWFGRKEIVEFIRSAAIRMALDESGWNDEHVRDLEIAVQALRWHRISAVLAALWDLLVHPAVTVRRVLVRLFNALAHVLDENRMAQRVLPALITLGNDPDADVRRACVRALAYIASKTESATILEKLGAQYDAMIDDAARDTDLEKELLIAFAGMIQGIEPRVRDDLVLPRVVRLGDRLCSATTVTTEQLRLLLACYQALNGAVVARDTIVSIIVPSLQRVVSAAPAWKVVEVDGDEGEGDSDSVVKFTTILRDMEHAIASEAEAAGAHKESILSIKGAGAGAKARARSVFGGLEKSFRRIPFTKK